MYILYIIYYIYFIILYIVYYTSEKFRTKNYQYSRTFKKYLKLTIFEILQAYLVLATAAQKSQNSQETLLKSSISKYEFKYPIQELARPLCFPVDAFCRWYKLNVGP